MSAERIVYVAGEKDAGRELKSVLRRELAMSESLISRVKLLGDGILLNGTRAHTNARIAPGDVISVKIADEPPDEPLRAAAYPLDIVFEDDYLLILDKPAGMAVHPGALSRDECTVANALAYHIGGSFVFHPVNRLDRGTTGLMAVAKNAYVHELLKRALHSERFYREYRAVADGTPQPERGTLELPVGRAGGSAIKREVREDGEAARTYYETLSQRDGRAFLRLIPFTGRTHQLRVHMAALGCPLAGDWLYGVEDRELIALPALHSYLLRLAHPVTGESLELTAPLPEDMRRLI